MPTLTPAQIQLAYDIEAIQEALASGFVLPPLADVTDELPVSPAPPVDPTPWTSPTPVAPATPVVPATTPVDVSDA